MSRNVISSMNMRWKKSTASAQVNCVEVAVSPNFVIHMRDSKDPDGVMLAFSARGWEGFVSELRSGQFAALD
jgi:hypothetical protein